ncbi:uncharacterized protein VP01_773g15 [Puccinia sorghi]|uniref:Uncharacterized protein n=1 Tax=Puccinia sorghi TaxID=27349 RepID=A0A0L6UBE7_9BASI|nr:uncharacterized protein VP01_773g15 [Puccinia sorghi]
MLNPITAAKPLSTRIMQSVSSDEVDGMIKDRMRRTSLSPSYWFFFSFPCRRIKADIKPLLERCQDQEKRINTLKESKIKEDSYDKQESLHPHLLSTRTAVSHLSHLASRAKKTISMIPNQTYWAVINWNWLAQKYYPIPILLEANMKLEKYIARQRHYEMKLTNHLSIGKSCFPLLRRLILILLTIKILIDMRITNQVMQFMNDLVPAEYLPSLLSHRDVPLRDHQPHSSPPNDDVDQTPPKRLSDFVAYLIWIAMVKLELF